MGTNHGPKRQLFKSAGSHGPSLSYSSQHNKINGHIDKRRLRLKREEANTKKISKAKQNLNHDVASQRVHVL